MVVKPTSRAPRWSHLARHGLLGTTLLAAAAPATASAEPCDELADRSVTLVLGLEVSPKVRVVGGIEGRQCLSDNTEAMLRLELGGDAPRLIAGARARPFETMAERDRDAEDLAAIGFEAGGVLDLHGRFGAHLAATYGAHFAYLAAQLHHRGDDRPARFSLLAAFSPWTVEHETSVAGRPLVRDGRMVAPAITRLPRFARAEDRAVRDHFARAARLEYSSVWAFLRLAAELAAVGAPAALIARALDAADDEVRHAEQCARAAGGVALAALPAELARPRFTARSPRALAVLAAEAWREGCIEEGAAAEEARLAAGEATANAAMLAAIAADERRHAELSWAVLAWIAGVEPARVASLRGRPVPARTFERRDPALARRGVPSAGVMAEAWATVARAAPPRLAQLAA